MQPELKRANVQSTQSTRRLSLITSFIAAACLAAPALGQDGERPSGIDVMNRAIDELGGRSALGRIRSLQLEIDVRYPDGRSEQIIRQHTRPSILVEEYREDPRSRVVQPSEEGAEAPPRVVKVWTRDEKSLSQLSDDSYRALSGAQLVQAQLESLFSPEFNWRRLYDVEREVDEGQIDRDEVWLVLATAKELPVREVRAYVKDTGLLRQRRVAIRATDGSTLRYTVDYTNYEQLQFARWPSQWRVIIDEGDADDAANAAGQAQRGRSQGTTYRAREIEVNPRLNRREMDFPELSEAQWASAERAGRPATTGGATATSAESGEGLRNLRNMAAALFGGGNNSRNVPQAAVIEPIRGGDEEEAAVELPKASEVLIAMVEARGGSQLFSALEGMRVSGNLEAFGRTAGTFERTMKRGGGFRLIADESGIRTDAGRNSSHSWVHLPVSPTGPVSQFERQDTPLPMLDPLDPFYDWTKAFSSGSVESIELIDGVQCYKLRMVPSTADGGDDDVIFAYIEVESKLPKRVETTQANGRINATDYADFRNVGGMKFPYAISVSRPLPVTFRVESIEVNPRFDASAFEPPAEVRNAGG